MEKNNLRDSKTKLNKVQTWNGCKQPVKNYSNVTKSTEPKG